MLLKLLWIFISLFCLSLAIGYFLGLFFSIPYGNIAVIEIHGFISSSGATLLGEPAIKAQDVIELITLANANPIIEGLILDINSPGGSAVPSALIMEAVLNFSKPVVAYIRDSGTSGAYLIASAANKIVAHNYSVIGAIGIALNPYLEFSGLMEDYNVTYINLSYPEHKDVGAPYREMSELEYNWSINKLIRLYDSFLSSASENRNMTIEELRPYANGSYYIGVEGLEYGLIDAIGSFNDAKDLLISIADIKYPQLVTLKKEVSYINLLSSYLSTQSPLQSVERIIVMT